MAQQSAASNSAFVVSDAEAVFMAREREVARTRVVSDLLVALERSGVMVLELPASTAFPELHPGLANDIMVYTIPDKK